MRVKRFKKWEGISEDAYFAQYRDGSRCDGAPYDAAAALLLRQLRHAPTHRVQLKPMVPGVQPAQNPDAGSPQLQEQLYGTPAAPYLGTIPDTESLELLQKHEATLEEIHRRLSSTGDSICTCTTCGVRSPEVNQLRCPMCAENPGRSAVGIETVPPKYSAGNAMSLHPPPTADPTVAAERVELARLAGEMTTLELALCRLATPLVSIYRLPQGQFGYKGHVIAVANDVRKIAETLPRSVQDAGATIMVGASGSLEKSLADPKFACTFRVRKAKVHRFLELLFKHHKYMKHLYPNGVDQDALHLLPEDGVPKSLSVVVHEDAATSTPPRLSELAVTSSAVKAWLSAGEEDPLSYPLAADAYRVWNDIYSNLLNDHSAVVAAMQGRAINQPRSDMVRIVDIVTYCGVTGVLRRFPEVYEHGLLKSHPRLPLPVKPPPAPPETGKKAPKQSKKDKAAAEARVRAQDDEVNKPWAAVDARFIDEFTRLANTGYSEDRSCVPAGFVPRRTEAERLDAVVGKELGDADRAGMHPGGSADVDFAMPKAGAAINERTQGFITLVYPELFPFGLGCFNEPRPVEVTFREWVPWVLNQDAGQLLKSAALGPPAAAPVAASLTPADQIQQAELADTQITFVSQHVAFKTMRKKIEGTGPGKRFVEYRAATTVREAFAAGASLSDLVTDFTSGVMTISSTSTPAPVVGAGLMRHAQSPLFGYHCMNWHLRDVAHGSAVTFVRKIANSFDDAAISAHLQSCDPADLYKQVMAFTSGLPNTPQYMRAHRKELMHMNDHFGPATIFGTHSAADTHDPHVHRLIVHWAGLAGTVRDPFVLGIEPKEAHARRCKNLADFPTMGAYYWHRKTELWRTLMLTGVLGFAHVWERTEYQFRGSPHGHWLAWHPHAPPTHFLDVIGDAATAFARAEHRAGLTAFDPERAAYYATALLSWDPEAVAAGSDQLSAGAKPELTRLYQHKCHFANVNAAELLESVIRAREASQWYGSMLDASNRLYDAAGEKIYTDAMSATPAPQVDPVELAQKALGLRAGDPVSLEECDVVMQDYAELRTGTCRHDECRASYCLRTKPGTKPPEQYCRFAESMSIRTYPSCEGVVGSPTAPAPTHYYATTAKARDGTDLLHYQVWPCPPC